jgi:hypothetical protein
MVTDLSRIIGLDYAIFGDLNTIPVIGGNSGILSGQWPDQFTDKVMPSLF